MSSFARVVLLISLCIILFLFLFLLASIEIVVAPTHGGAGVRGEIRPPPFTPSPPSKKQTVVAAARGDGSRPGHDGRDVRRVHEGPRLRRGTIYYTYFSIVLEYSRTLYCNTVCLIYARTVALAIVFMPGLYPTAYRATFPAFLCGWL